MPTVYAGFFFLQKLLSQINLLLTIDIMQQYLQAHPTQRFLVGDAVPGRPAEHQAGLPNQ